MRSCPVTRPAPAGRIGLYLPTAAAAVVPLAVRPGPAAAGPAPPKFSSSNFVPGAPIDNPYFPLKPGTVFRAAGEVTDPDTGGGARPTSEGFRVLAAMGVRTIIDLQERDESADVPACVRYVPLRVSPWHCDRVDTAAVLRAIADNPKPVFIHCRGGRDRTGLAVADYRLSRGASPAEAIQELDGYGIHFWRRPSVVRRVQDLAARAAPADAGQ